MDRSALMDALVLNKRMNNLLNEIMDLSRQMAEAVDRNDRVAAEMLIGMRAEPIAKLRTADQALRVQLDDLPREERAWLTKLLNGGEAAETAEQPLVDQVAANARLLKRVRELDEVLNRKLTREKSVYR